MKFRGNFIEILCAFSLLGSAFGAYVSDLKSGTDCKALLAQKTDERAKNPDLVREILVFSSDLV